MHRKIPITALTVIDSFLNFLVFLNKAKSSESTLASADTHTHTHAVAHFVFTTHSTHTHAYSNSYVVRVGHINIFQPPARSSRSVAYCEGRQKRRAAAHKMRIASRSRRKRATQTNTTAHLPPPTGAASLTKTTQRCRPTTPAEQPPAHTLTAHRPAQ